MGNFIMNHVIAAAGPDNVTVDPALEQQHRILLGIAHLEETCGRFYGRFVRPLLQRLLWLTLFPRPHRSAESRRAWIEVGRHILTIVDRMERGPPPCAPRDWDVLRDVLGRVVDRCPHDDIRSQVIGRLGRSAAAPSTVDSNLLFRSVPRPFLPHRPMCGMADPNAAAEEEEEEETRWQRRRPRVPDEW
jgi:hypothetical protein